MLGIKITCSKSVLQNASLLIHFVSISGEFDRVKPLPVSHLSLTGPHLLLCHIAGSPLLRLDYDLSNDAYHTNLNKSGNHETGGTWKQGAMHEDVEDMNAVVSYLKANYGYEIELIVGHSRGSLVGFRWISTTEEGRKVSAFINVSGRYRMRVSLLTSPLPTFESSLVDFDPFCAP